MYTLVQAPLIDPYVLGPQEGLSSNYVHPTLIAHCFYRPGSKLRTDLMADGGVAPVISSTQAAAEAAALLGGAEEKFAFARAVSRLYEMQSPLFVAARPRQ